MRQDGLQQRLSQYLPEQQRSPAMLEQLLRSPQFASQLKQFSQALQSGRLNLSQFGLDASTAGFSVLQFLEAIEAAAVKPPTGGEDTGGADA